MAAHRLLPAGSFAEVSRTFTEGSALATLRDDNHSLTVRPELDEEFTIATTRDGSTITAAIPDTRLARVGRMEFAWQAEREDLDENHDKVAAGMLRRSETVEVVGGLYSDVFEVNTFLKGDFRQDTTPEILDTALQTAVDWIDHYTRTVWSPRWENEVVGWPYSLSQWDVREVLVVQDAQTGEAVEGVQWDSLSRRLVGEGLPALLRVGYAYGPAVTPADISYCAARLGSHVVRLIFSAQATTTRSVQSESGLIQLNIGGSYMRPTGMGEVDAILTQRRRQTWVY